MDTWNWIGRIDNVLGIGTFIAAAYAAYRLWQQNRKFHRQARESKQSVNLQQYITNNEGVQSEKPVAFALALTPNNPSIKPQVERFLKIKQWEMPIKELAMAGIEDANDLQQLVDDLQEKKRLFQLEGYTELHLFLNGPVAAGVIIGALFDNWIPVKIYQKPRVDIPQIYEYWMPLIGS